MNLVKCLAKGFGIVSLLTIIVQCAVVFAQTPKEEDQMANAQAVSTVIVFETNRGNIELKLFDIAAPKTVENFVGLVQKGYYDGTVFHRVIKSFMIQGGDPTATGRGGESLWGGKFEDELNAQFKFDRPGILAMANAGPNTNGSQFFITTVPTPWLNMKHTIFGEVSGGYDIVTAIEQSPVSSGDHPKEEQKIIKAYIKTK